MVRETAMRLAFVRAVQSVIESDKPVRQERLVKRVARVVDSGSGILRPRRAK